MSSKNLLTALLHPDPKKRLGAVGGASDIKGIRAGLSLTVRFSFL
jgi:hypothetical protein